MRANFERDQKATASMFGVNPVWLSGNQSVERIDANIIDGPKQNQEQPPPVLAGDSTTKLRTIKTNAEVTPNVCLKDESLKPAYQF